MTEFIEQTLISPRYLAGSGDPAWVTVPLRRACGWSTAGDPLVPRVILTSPDQIAQLRIAPDPDPAEPWWTLRHAHHGDQRAWEIIFDAQTPVEIIAAVTDTLTAPAPPPTASSDAYDPLRAAGWHAPRHHDGLTSPKGMTSPDGLARVDRIVDESGRSTGWIVETSVHHLPAIWRAYADGNTPSHVASAFFGRHDAPHPACTPRSPSGRHSRQYQHPAGQRRVRRLRAQEPHHRPRPAEPRIVAVGASRSSARPHGASSALNGTTAPHLHAPWNSPLPQPNSTSTDGYDIAFRVLGVALAIAVPLANLAWVGGTITARITDADTGAPYQPVAALLHPEQLWPHLGETSLLIGTRIVPGTLLLSLAVTAAVLYKRHKDGGSGRKKRVVGMAKHKDIEPLMSKAITAKARSLRPSLKDAKHIDAGDSGILLGNLQGTKYEVRMGYEDVAVAIMAPRSGKTTSLAIPSILAAPGPVLLTSNKAAGDAYTATIDARAVVGRTWSMDPQQIAHAERAMWWNPLADAKTLDGAGRLAGHFLAASVDASQQGDFWSKAGSNILSQLFLAAALAERPITDVMAWLAFPADRTPLDILRDHGFAAVAAQLKGTVEGPPETRDGIFETARQYAAALLNTEIAAWVTPQKNVPEFTPSTFVTSKDTLYLLSKDGGGGASALIAACADSVMRAATAQAERAGGRLDPPMLAILDEAANVCKISDLPDLYSHLGSRGIIPMTILQSYRQGQKVWGDAGMDAMWSASTIKVIGSGIDDPDFADKLSRLIGDHDVETTSTSTSDSGKSTSVSMRQERILAADAIRALPKGTALAFATGLRAAMLDLRPWYLEPGARELSAASARASKGITERAVAKAAPKQSDFGPAA